MIWNEYCYKYQSVYGCIESAMLWYNLYTSTLQGMGFELNPYDLCVANKMINGKQCTIEQELCQAAPY